MRNNNSNKKENDSTTINKAELEKIVENVSTASVLKPTSKNKAVVVNSMVEKYKKAYFEVYNKEQEWRRKEIDKCRNDGSMNRWDLDFVRKIIEIAEKI